jgi:hypothetical protein
LNSRYSACRDLTNSGQQAFLIQFCNQVEELENTVYLTFGSGYCPGFRECFSCPVCKGLVPLANSQAAQHQGLQVDCFNAIRLPKKGIGQGHC